MPHLGQRQKSSFDHELQTSSAALTSDQEAIQLEVEFLQWTKKLLDRKRGFACSEDVDEDVTYMRGWFHQLVRIKTQTDLVRLRLAPLACSSMSSMSSVFVMIFSPFYSCLLSFYPTISSGVSMLRTPILLSSILARVNAIVEDDEED